MGGRLFMKCKISRIVWMVSMTQKKKCKKKANLFFELGMTSLNKHYTKWIDPLLIVSVFGEAATAKCVAQVLLGDDSHVEDDQAVFASPIHGKNINLNDFKEFIKAKMKDQIKNGTHVIQTVGLQKLQLIANGLDIWAQPGVKPSERDPNAQHLIDIYFMNFAFLKSSTHDIEAAVKEANFIAKANCSEVANSHRASVCK